GICHLDSNPDDTSQVRHLGFDFPHELIGLTSGVVGPLNLEGHNLGQATAPFGKPLQQFSLASFGDAPDNSLLSPLPLNLLEQMPPVPALKADGPQLPSWFRPTGFHRDCASWTTVVAECGCRVRRRCLGLLCRIIFVRLRNPLWAARRRVR